MEGTQSTWLVEILSPHVAEIVVTHVSTSRGPKDDARDAFALAQQLRTHAVTTPVDKQVWRVRDAATVGQGARVTGFRRWTVSKSSRQARTSAVLSTRAGRPPWKATNARA